jgi:hypothetical protein
MLVSDAPVPKSSPERGATVPFPMSVGVWFLFLVAL